MPHEDDGKALLQPGPVPASSRVRPSDPWVRKNSAAGRPPGATTEGTRATQLLVSRQDLDSTRRDGRNRSQGPFPKRRRGAVARFGSGVHHGPAEELPSPRQRRR